MQKCYECKYVVEVENCMNCEPLNRSQTMFELAKASCEHLGRRMKTCKEAAESKNTMIDCGWSDTRYKASWMQEYFRAQYRFERITQRFMKGA